MSMDLIRALRDTLIIDEKGQQLEVKAGRTYRINEVQPVSEVSDMIFVMLTRGVCWTVKNEDWEMSAFSLS